MKNYFLSSLILASLSSMPTQCRLVSPHSIQSHCDQEGFELYENKCVPPAQVSWLSLDQTVTESDQTLILQAKLNRPALKEKYFTLSTENSSATSDDFILLTSQAYFAQGSQVSDPINVKIKNRLGYQSSRFIDIEIDDAHLILTINDSELPQTIKITSFTDGQIIDRSIAIGRPMNLAVSGTCSHEDEEIDVSLDRAFGSGIWAWDEDLQDNVIIPQRTTCVGGTFSISIPLRNHRSVFQNSYSGPEELIAEYTNASLGSDVVNLEMGLLTPSTSFNLASGEEPMDYDQVYDDDDHVIQLVYSDATDIVRRVVPDNFSPRSDNPRYTNQDGTVNYSAVDSLGRLVSAEYKFSLNGSCDGGEWLPMKGVDESPVFDLPIPKDGSTAMYSWQTRDPINGFVSNCLVDRFQYIQLQPTTYTSFILKQWGSNIPIPQGQSTVSSPSLEFYMDIPIESGSGFEVYKTMPDCIQHVSVIGSINGSVNGVPFGGIDLTPGTTHLYGRTALNPAYTQVFVRGDCVDLNYELTLP